MNRPLCGHNAAFARTLVGLNAVADYPRTRTGYGHGRCATADSIRTQIVRGHRQDADICGPDTEMNMDWLRTRLRAWPGHGYGLDIVSVEARMRTGHGLDSVTDWTRTRPAGRALARTFRDPTATSSRTQNP
jgi:hypothetical protein